MTPFADDTQLCLALGEALLEAGGMEERLVVERFLRWMSRKPADIGHTIRQGLINYKLLGKLQAEYSEHANSNGALMRNLPVIIATLHTPELMADWSRRQGLITHHNREAENGMLMISQVTQQVLLHAQSAPVTSLISPWFAEFPRFDYTRYKQSVDGYIADTIKTVLFFFLNTPDFESCLIGVVNAGGDADTNGALAGMLAAPFYGLYSIPQRWLKKLDRTVLTAVTKQIRQLIERFWER